jgi:protein-S-isoprenylcysteine O-methyltransferase Ste14
MVRKTESKVLSFLRGLKNLLGVGGHLLLLGLFLEILTIVAQQWISFPIPLTVEMQVILTVPCVLLSLLGMVWFNRSLNLVKINLLGGRSELITYGPFSYVRHPLYATLLIALPPLMIIWYADFLFLIPWILILIIAHYVVSLEERGLVEAFGQDYELYRKHVPALLPYKGRGGQRYREENRINGTKSTHQPT